MLLAYADTHASPLSISWATSRMNLNPLDGLVVHTPGATAELVCAIRFRASIRRTAKYGLT